MENITGLIKMYTLLSVMKWKELMDWDREWNRMISNGCVKEKGGEQERQTEMGIEIYGMKHMIGIYIYKLWAANTICLSYFYKLCWSGNDMGVDKISNNLKQGAIYCEMMDVQASESHLKIPTQNEKSFVNSNHIISFRMNETFFDKGTCLILQIKKLN